MNEHPEEMPDGDLPTGAWIDEQSWWLDHPELAALDSEVEDATWPAWTADVITSYDFQSAYPSPVVPLWNLDRISRYSIRFLNERVENRKARLERLRGLGAPRIIIQNEQQLVCEAAAAYYWSLARRFGEAANSG